MRTLVVFLFAFTMLLRLFGATGAAADSAAPVAPAGGGGDSCWNARSLHRTIEDARLSAHVSVAQADSPLGEILKDISAQSGVRFGAVGSTALYKMHAYMKDRSLKSAVEALAECQNLAFSRANIPQAYALWLDKKARDERSAAKNAGRSECRTALEQTAKALTLSRDEVMRRVRNGAPEYMDLLFDSPRTGVLVYSLLGADARGQLWGAGDLRLNSESLPYDSRVRMSAEVGALRKRIASEFGDEISEDAIKSVTLSAGESGGLQVSVEFDDGPGVHVNIGQAAGATARLAGNPDLFTLDYAGYDPEGDKPPKKVRTASPSALDVKYSGPRHLGGKWSKVLEQLAKATGLSIVSDASPVEESVDAFEVAERNTVADVIEEAALRANRTWRFCRGYVILRHREWFRLQEEFDDIAGSGLGSASQAVGGTELSAVAAPTVPDEAGATNEELRK